MVLNAYMTLKGILKMSLRCLNWVRCGKRERNRNYKDREREEMNGKEGVGEMGEREKN